MIDWRMKGAWEQGYFGFDWLSWELKQNATSNGMFPTFKRLHFGWLNTWQDKLNLVYLCPRTGLNHKLKAYQLLATKSSNTRLESIPTLEFCESFVSFIILGRVLCSQSLFSHWFFLCFVFLFHNFNRHSLIHLAAHICAYQCGSKRHV